MIVKTSGCHSKKVQNINDYNVNTRHNKDYWAMIVQDRIALAFSRNFAYTLNDVVLEFQSSKPIYEPPCMVNLCMVEMTSSMELLTSYTQSTSLKTHYTFQISKQNVNISIGDIKACVESECELQC
jgi:hypothetical protein